MANAREYPVMLTKGYWERSKSDRKLVLASILFAGIKKSDTLSAQNSYEDIENQIEEISVMTLPNKLRASVELLAQASKGYLKDGPFGPRPILLSIENIVKISGGEASDSASYWRAINSIYGGFQELVGDLSASNPGKHPEIKYTNYDVAKGIVLPPAPENVPELMGLLLADGILREGGLCLAGRYSDLTFYENYVLKLVENSFNYSAKLFLEENPILEWDRSDGRVVNFSRKVYPRIKIDSAAISQWMNLFFGSENLKIRISEYFAEKNIDEDVRQKMINAFLAGKAKLLHRNNGSLRLEIRNSTSGLENLLSKAGVTSQNTQNSEIIIPASTSEKHIPLILGINPDFLSRQSVESM